MNEKRMGKDKNKGGGTTESQRGEKREEGKW